MCCILETRSLKVVKQVFADTMGMFVLISIDSIFEYTFLYLINWLVPDEKFPGNSFACNINVLLSLFIRESFYFRRVNKEYNCIVDNPPRLDYVLDKK